MLEAGQEQDVSHLMAIMYCKFHDAIMYCKLRDAIMDCKLHDECASK